VSHGKIHDSMKNSKKEGCDIGMEQPFPSAPPDDTEEDGLECPVCFLVFDQPRQLPCSHVFCSACLRHIIEVFLAYLEEMEFSLSFSPLLSTTTLRTVLFAALSYNLAMLILCPLLKNCKNASVLCVLPLLLPKKKTWGCQQEEETERRQRRQEMRHHTPSISSLDSLAKLDSFSRVIESIF